MARSDTDEAIVEKGNPESQAPSPKQYQKSSCQLKGEVCSARLLPAKVWQAGQPRARAGLHDPKRSHLEIRIQNLAGRIVMPGQAGLAITGSVEVHGPRQILQLRQLLRWLLELYGNYFSALFK